MFKLGLESLDMVVVLFCTMYSLFFYMYSALDSNNDEYVLTL